MTKPAHPSGFALPTLLVMLSMASIAVLLALRNLGVNERLLNAEADLLRTQHQAEAVLPVALADILGSADARHNAGDASQTHAFFPTTLSDYDVLRQRLSSTRCQSGICAPNALLDDANKASFWKTQTANAMAVPLSDGNLTAWYWVDIFPQANTNRFVYRITVLAHGVMPSSTVVLQTLWVRHIDTSTTGEWRSWHLLHD